MQRIIYTSLILLNIGVIVIFYWGMTVPPYEAIDRYFRRDPWAEKLHVMTDDELANIFPAQYLGYIYLQRAKEGTDGWPILGNLHAALEENPQLDEAYEVLEHFITEIPIEVNLAKYFNALHAIEGIDGVRLKQVLITRFYQLKDAPMEHKKDFKSELIPPLRLIIDDQVE